MSNTKEFLNRIERLAYQAGRSEQTLSELYRREQDMRVARDEAVAHLRQVKTEQNRLRAEIETLRAQVAAAGDSGELERLRAEVCKLRTLNDALLQNTKRLRTCVRRIGEHVELFENHPKSMRTAILQDLADCNAPDTPAPASEPEPQPPVLPPICSWCHGEARFNGVTCVHCHGSGREPVLAVQIHEPVPEGGE